MDLQRDAGEHGSDTSALMSFIRTNVLSPLEKNAKQRAEKLKKVPSQPLSSAGFALP